jgi:hypothetical protein
MTVEFLAPAEDEFSEAIAYYNEQSEGLGFEFAIELKNGLRRIVQYPDAWAPISARTRRHRIKRFPYGILYQIRDTCILVVAVQNLHKHPDSWKERLDPKAS